MPFSRRSANSAILHMIKTTGQKVACYWRNQVLVPERVPQDLYDDSSSPDDVNVTLYYIFATFSSTTTEDPTDPAGLRGTVFGTLIIPYQYRDIVNRTEYFDPYLNGSKFLKVGAIVDDQGITVTQKIRAEYLPQIGEIQ